jgi:hypothetical protein
MATSPIMIISTYMTVSSGFGNDFKSFENCKKWGKAAMRFSPFFYKMLLRNSGLRSFSWLEATPTLHS